VKPFHLVGLLLACVVLCNCAGSSSQFNASPARTAGAPTNDVMRPGDKVTLRLTGVPDEGYLIEVQIPQSGDITVPLLLQPFHAAGRTAGDLALEITQAYKSQRIYTTPEVTVIPEERYVSVGGDVRTPNRVLYTPDLTLLTAINACGGFTDYAKRTSVRILRGQQVLYYDCAAIARGATTDPALYPGDQIYVPRTIF
jgi:polysaccharide export outer membrane protein